MNPLGVAYLAAFLKSSEEKGRSRLKPAAIAGLAAGALGAGIGAMAPGATVLGELAALDVLARVPLPMALKRPLVERGYGLPIKAVLRAGFEPAWLTRLRGARAGIYTAIPAALAAFAIGARKDK